MGVSAVIKKHRERRLSTLLRLGRRDGLIAPSISRVSSRGDKGPQLSLKVRSRFERNDLLAMYTSSTSVFDL